MNRQHLSFSLKLNVHKCLNGTSRGLCAENDCRLRYFLYQCTMRNPYKVHISVSSSRPHSNMIPLFLNLNRMRDYFSHKYYIIQIKPFSQNWVHSLHVMVLVVSIVRPEICLNTVLTHSILETISAVWCWRYITLYMRLCSDSRDTQYIFTVWALMCLLCVYVCVCECVLRYACAFFWPHAGPFGCNKAVLARSQSQMIN